MRTVPRNELVDMGLEISVVNFENSVVEGDGAIQVGDENCYLVAGVSSVQYLNYAGYAKAGVDSIQIGKVTDDVSGKVILVIHRVTYIEANLWYRFEYGVWSLVDDKAVECVDKWVANSSNRLPLTLEEYNKEIKSLFSRKELQHLGHQTVEELINLGWNSCTMVRELQNTFSLAIERHHILERNEGTTIEKG